MTKIKICTATTSRYPEALVNSIKDLPDIEIVPIGNISKNATQGAQNIIDQNPTILHLQWPESHVNRKEKGDELLAIYQDFFKIIKNAGIKIVWTQHNIMPHDYRDCPFFKSIYELFATNSDGLIHHSQWGKKYFHEEYKSDALDSVIRHGAFADEATYKGSKEDARNELNIPHDTRVFFTLGGTRKDKNLEALLGCFKKRENKNELLIFSSSSIGNDEYIDEIRALAKTVKNIRIHEGNMPDEELAINARASDAFIFAYGDKNLTSGSPHLSQAHGIPQVVLPSPYSDEIMGETGLFFEPTPSIMEGLNRFLDELDDERLNKCQKHFQTIPEDYQWETIGKQTLAFYKKVLSN